MSATRLSIAVVETEAVGAKRPPGWNQRQERAAVPGVARTWLAGSKIYEVRSI